MTIGHGDTEVVQAGPPCHMKIKLDVLIVHKERTFQQKDVWFYVYKGSLPDAMLSDDFLNSIPCSSHPGTKLIDTRARDSDLPLLLQTMEDYRNLTEHRVNTATTNFRKDLDDTVLKNTNMFENLVGHPSDPTSPNHQMFTTELHSPPQVNNATTSSSKQSRTPEETEHDHIKRLLADMANQRAALAARLGKPISEEALAACMSVLDRYPENFRPPGPDPCKLGVYKIVLKDKSKFHIALPRRVNAIMLQEIRRQVEELVAQGAIERCITRPASVYAIVMARRPNAPGKYRLCVDLVEGNNNTVPAPYAIPSVQEALDRLSGKSLYSTFDFSSWFHQFEIEEEDRDKVAFIVPGDNLTPPQIYRYKRVAFGLMNATYFCQRQLQEALEQWPGCEGIFPFVDDIVIATDDLEEMLVKLEHFMKFCHHHNIRLKKEKTELATTAVKHVGFIISKEGQSLDPARVDSLLTIGAPKNIDGLKSLLGSFGFIRGWLADCAKTTAPLTDLMAGSAKRLKLDWGDVQDHALAALKLSVLLAPAKVSPDYSLPFHVYVDASDVGVAAVLIQWRTNDEGELLPFAIFHSSRRWAPREAKWSIAVREMYAIKYGLFKFKDYLQGCPNVTVWSDHLNLVNGLWKHSCPKIQRWRMFLESMRPFFLKHVSGTDRMQLVADSLSRLHTLNLFLEKTTEELDAETILMMERGEGEDDLPMFGENYTKLASTQTDGLTDIQSHNASAAFSIVYTPKELHLQSKYGNGFKIASRNLSSIEAALAKDPLQPTPIKRTRETRRPGIGFCPEASAPNSENFKRNQAAIPYTLSSDSKSTDPLGKRVGPLTSDSKILNHQSQHSLETSETFTSPPPSDPNPLSSENPPAHSANSSSAIPPDAPQDSSITLCKHVCDWEESEENRECCSIFSHATVATTSQTTPQDFRDASSRASGGFPLGEDLLKKAHDDTHPGFTTTWRRVIRALGPQSTSEGAKTKAEVKRYCDACIVCQKLQPARAKILADVGSIRQRPFTSYAFDVITLSSPDEDGVRYILCCVDSFSRAVELYGLRQANAPSVLVCLNDVLCRWGRASELRCDNAKAFTSAMVTALLQRAKVKQHLTAPYSHQSNGQVENCNRRVMDILRAMILDGRIGANSHTKWSLLLPDVRRVLMTRTITQHGCTPNDLAYMNCPETEASIFEEEPWLPAKTTSPTDQEDEPEWLRNLAAQHEYLIDICDERQDELLQKLAQANEANRATSKLRPLQVHDFALLKLTDRPQDKIQPRWAGPYLVISFPNNDPNGPKVTLQHIATKKVGDFHVNMLKHCDMSLMKKIEDAIPYAAADNFEYEIESILEHQPSGPRRTKDGLQDKKNYTFKCLWKDLPTGPDNPSWEPWGNESMRSTEAYKDYVQQKDVITSLGAKF